MSDSRFAPYGQDDDPFLTPPAGVGRAPVRASHDEYWGEPQADYRSAPPAQSWQRQQAQPSYGQGAAPSAYPQEAPLRGYTPGHAGAGAGNYAASHQGSRGYHPQEFDPDDAQGYGQSCDQGYGQDYSQTYARPVAVAASEPEQGNFARRVPAAPQHSHQPAGPARSASFAAPPRQGQTREPVAAPTAPRQYYAPAQPTHVAQHAPVPNHGAAGAPRHYAPPPPNAAADFAAETYGFTPQFAPQMGAIMHWAGALCTVAVLLGAGYWGYALAVRDAHGIPVVRAAEGPLRIAPEIPGGETSAHQGLAVNSIPAAAAAPLPAAITLAPQVATLAPEDTGQTVGEASTITESGSFAEVAGADTQALAGASDAALNLPQAAAVESADLTALPNALPEDMPLTDEEAVERALEMALSEGGDGAVASDAAPDQPAEPVSMSATDPSAPADAPIAPPTAEIDPTTIALGTPMVQLGAFDDEATARAEWANLQTRFTELVGGKSLVVQQAKSGGRDFYRLRAHGFESEDETRRFCAAILAENATCLPVVQR